VRPDVALVSPYPLAGRRHDGPSGVASYTANLAHALAAAGAAVTVVAPEEAGAADEPRVRDDGSAVRVVRAFRRGRGAVPAAARAAAATGARVVHLQHELFLYGGPTSVPGLVPALAGLRRRGLGPVVTMHQVLDPARVGAGTARLHRVSAPVPVARAGIGAVQRSIGHLARATIVHERPFADVVRGAEVVPHGLETVRAADRATARAELGLDDRFTALCFGFLAPYKGLEIALEAAGLLGRDVRLVVGGGEHPRLAGRDRYADELRARYGGVAHFTGPVPDGDVAAWFAAADVALFCYPEPFASSGALALALAHGTPALVSPPLARCIGAPDDVVVALEPHALAARLVELATSPPALAALAGWTAALADGRSWPVVAARHLDVYERVGR
jgi:glycosyltransferase involved in cell wall biosynthesis